MDFLGGCAVCRIRTSAAGIIRGSFSLGNTIMDMPRDAKYGMTEDQMAGAFQCLAQKGARQFGIHALLASNAGSNSIIRNWLPSCSAWRCGFTGQPGSHIAFVNLSGGVGVDYRPEQPACDIAAIGKGFAGSMRPF